MATKKRTADVNVKIAEIDRFANLDVMEAAVGPSIDSATLSPQIYNMIDFVNVTDTIGPSQG